MLRDSKLQFGRPSPAMRVLTVGAVLLCGLLAAGLRGPASEPQAQAADTTAVQPSAAADDRDVIDWSLVPAKALFVAAARPATILQRPELVALGKLLDADAIALKATEVEQATVAILDVRSLPKRPSKGLPRAGNGIMPNVVSIIRMTKPNDFRTFPNGPGQPPRKTEKRAYRGLTYYCENVEGPQEISSFYMRPDDRTLVAASSEDAIKEFIEAHSGQSPGLLGRPTFINAEQWKAFRDDQAVVAASAQMVVKWQALMTENGEPRPSLLAFLAPFAPLWQETTQGLVGVRIGGDVKLHAILVGKNGEAAEKVEKTIEGARLLALNMIRTLTAQSPRIELKSASEVALAFLDALKTERDGLAVGLHSAISTASVSKLLPSMIAAREAARRLHTANQLKQISLAMHNYAAANKCFPPAVFYGPDGKTPYSWRVALLPYLEHEDLHRQYHFDEPWDGPNNRKLLAKMPNVFRAPGDPATSTNASYFVLTGPGTMFDGKEGTRFGQIRDGLSNTILAVEARRDIPWTKPEDIPYDPDKPLPKLGGHFEGRFAVALADGSVRTLSTTASEKVLRLLITKADGQIVNVDDAKPPAESP